MGSLEEIWKKNKETATSTYTLHIEKT